MLDFAGPIAHPGQPLLPHDLWQAWNLAPIPLLAMGLAAWFYGRGLQVKAGRGGQEPWRAWAFVGAWLALFAALISPLDRLAGALFSAHMVQHLLLILAAAPLLAVSAPLGTLLLGLPHPWQ